MKSSKNVTGPAVAALPPEAGTTPQPGAAAAPAPNAKLDPVRLALHNVDFMVQGHAERIRAICRAAQARLSPGGRALLDVHELLGIVGVDISELENVVNCEAARHGAEYVDEGPHPLMSRFAPAAAEVNHG